jgi:aryl-alcohol dehydrogenase-like predicted oxidoreductase
VLNAARRLGATEHQVVLAWLLASSPAMLPIPGTGSPEHVAENIAAAALELTGDEQRAIRDGG